MWFLANHLVEYTYFRDNYGSRLDRIYVRDLYCNVTNVDNIPVSWSDHCMIKVLFKIKDANMVGKGYWKLNSSLLSEDIVIDNFEYFLEKYSKKEIRLW